jgi:hypothetical protein
MNDETGLSKNRTVSAIATSKACMSLCLLSKILPNFIRIKIFVDIIIDTYMFLVTFY